jgi:hypothetical protein
MSSRGRSRSGQAPGCRYIRTKTSKTLTSPSSQSRSESQPSFVRRLEQRRQSRPPAIGSSRRGRLARPARLDYHGVLPHESPQRAAPCFITPGEAVATMTVLSHRCALARRGRTVPAPSAIGPLGARHARAFRRVVAPLAQPVATAPESWLTTSRRLAPLALPGDEAEHHVLNKKSQACLCSAPIRLGRPVTDGDMCQGPRRSRA